MQLLEIRITRVNLCSVSPCSLKPSKNVEMSVCVARAG
jgi:hypothetical protein